MASEGSGKSIRDLAAEVASGVEAAATSAGGADAAGPDSGSRPSKPFEALDDLAFLEQFRHRFPRGTIVTEGAELQALVAGAHRQAQRIRDLEAAATAAATRERLHQPTVDGAKVLAGEVAIRRFIDDVAEVGLPATIYQAFTPEYRRYIGARLQFVAEAANRLLGQLHALPAEAIAARDARYAERDKRLRGDSAGLEEEADTFADLATMFNAPDGIDPFAADDDDDEAMPDAA